MPELSSTPPDLTASPARGPGNSSAAGTPSEQASGRWTDPDAWTIALEGEVDDNVVTGLQHQIAAALTGYDRIMIDLRAVRVLSTYALARMCVALRHAYRPGVTLIISDAPAPARQALQACDLPGVELAPARLT